MTTPIPALETLESRQCLSSVTGTVQTIAGGNVGQYSSLAISPVSLRPAIAFYDAKHHDLKFTQFNGRSWLTVTVDSPGNVGQYASLKFDSGGSPWIAYYDATNHDLKLANRVGSVWKTQVVDSGGSQGTGASLALTHRNQPVIAYQGTTTGNGAGLKLATHSKTGWSIQTVDAVSDSSFGAPGAFCSLALDSRDRARISYQSEDLALRYAAYDGANWKLQTVQRFDLGETGDATSLVLDSAGHPFITYCYPFSQAEGVGGTFLATNLGAGWKTTRVDTSNRGEGSDASDVSPIILNSAGSPIVAYRTVGSTAGGSDDNNLVLAASDGSSYNDNELTTDGSVGGYLSMASEPDGRVLISYYNQATQSLNLFISAGKS